jgi:hypothetical protein
MKSYTDLINEVSEQSSQVKAMNVQRFIDSQLAKGYRTANESSYGFRIHKDDLGKFKASLMSSHFKQRDGTHHSWRSMGLTSNMYSHFAPKSSVTHPEVYIDSGHDKDGYHYVNVE